MNYRGVEMNTNKCRHFNGLGIPNYDKCCDAGVNYRQLVGGGDLGWATRAPCLPDLNRSDQAVVPCEKFSAMTADDIEARKREIDESIDRMGLLIPLIGKLKTDYPDGGAGVVDCPKCGARLHFSVAARNGHVHGHCETKGCLSWME